jgi:hypothetical protein
MIINKTRPNGEIQHNSHVTFCAGDENKMMNSSTIVLFLKSFAKTKEVRSFIT